MKIKCTFPFDDFGAGYAKVRDDLAELATRHDSNVANANAPFSARVHRTEAVLIESAWEIVVDGLTDYESILMAYLADGSYSVQSALPNSPKIVPTEDDWLEAIKHIAPDYPDAFAYRLDEKLAQSSKSAEPSKFKL